MEPDDPEAAHAKKDRRHGELIAEHRLGQRFGLAVLGFAVPLEQPRHLEGPLHHQGFEAGQLAERRSEQQGKHDRSSESPFDSMVTPMPSVMQLKTFMIFFLNS